MSVWYKDSSYARAQKIMTRWVARLGTGLMLAAAAVGVSHLFRRSVSQHLVVFFRAKPVKKDVQLRGQRELKQGPPGDFIGKFPGQLDAVIQQQGIPFAPHDF